MKSCGDIQCRKSIIPKRAIIRKILPYTEHVTSAYLGSTNVYAYPHNRIKHCPQCIETKATPTTEGKAT